MTEGGGGYKEPPERLFGISVKGGGLDQKTERLDGSFRLQGGGGAWDLGKGKTLSTMSSLEAPLPAPICRRNYVKSSNTVPETSPRLLGKWTPTLLLNN